MVGGLTESGEGDSTVESSGTFLSKNEIQSVGGISIFGNVERVGHRVHLSLQSNLDDLHRTDDGDSFSDSSSETS